MRAVWTIYRRELAGLFLGPLAWILLCLALFLNGTYFTLVLTATGGDVTGSMQWALGSSPLYWVLMLLLPPLLTMRMVSEEARTGLLEFLFTAPISDLSVVLGKLLAATTFMAVVWCSALVYALVLQSLGGPVDWGPVWTGVLGSALLSGLFCAIGLMASAGTGTPLLAAFVAFVINVGLLSLPFLTGLLGFGPDHWVPRTLARLDLVVLFQSSFLVGVLDTASVAFFLAWTAFFVFLATRLLESRRWRA